jgi:Mce-associated membrane protein
VTNTPDQDSTAAKELTEATEATEVTEAPKAAEATDTKADDVVEADETAETEADETAEAEPVVKDGKTTDWARVVAYGVLPALALILALVAGWLKFVDSAASDAANARTESIQAAKEGTTALLSYQPDTVEQQLTDARKLLTGEFLNSYTDLTTNVVIPGAKQKHISAVANVPAAASVSADQEHAVVLVFIDQTVSVGGDAPSATSSSVRVTMDNVGGKWLISKFEPV